MKRRQFIQISLKAFLAQGLLGPWQRAQASIGSRRKSSVNRSGYQILSDLGLLTSLVVCLDAGDSASTDGASQIWTDRSSGANHFYRGTGSGADAADPTFNGIAGHKSASEYFSFDGGDRFTPTGSPTYDDSWHKNNAAFTIATAIYIPTAATYQYIATNHPGTGSPQGIFLQLNDSSQLLFTSCNGSVFTDKVWGNYAPLYNRWALLMISVNEGGGAGASHWNVNGTVSTFDGAYTSPTTTNAGGPLCLSGQTAASKTLVSGSKMGLFFAWNRTLSQAETASIYDAIGSRFGV